MDLDATHHRAVSGGWVTGTATPPHQGRTTATWVVEVADEQGRRVSRG